MAGPWNSYAPASDGPWNSYAAAAAPPGFGPAPDFDLKRPKAQADLSNMQTDQAHTAAETRRLNAQAPFDAGTAQANLTKAQAEADIAKQKADEAKASAAIATMGPNSDVTGPEYLRRFVPPSQWNTVRAYARGDLGSRSGGMSTSMLPIIQHAMNFDHSASGVNFPARVKMQSDLAGNQPGTIGGGLRSFEQSIFHAQDVLRKGAALDNYGPGLAGSVGNYLRTGYERAAKDPTLNTYEEAVRNYAPETQKSVSGAAGGQAEREDRASGFDASLPQAARVGALQSDIGMGGDRAVAINDQYRRVMGRDITDALSPQARAAYDEVMAGGYDPKGNALFPARGYKPGSVLGGAGGSGGGGGPGDPLNNPGGGGGDVSLATGPSRLVNDPKAGALINTLVRRGANADEINAALTPLGYPAVDPKDVATWQTFLRKNPNFRGQAGGDVQREVPTTGWNRITASPLGTGAIAAVDSALGGTTDEITGAINSVVTGTPLSQAIADANAKKELAFRTNPTASVIGTLAGSAAGYYGGAKLLGGTAMAAAAGRYAPYAGSAAYGAASGFGQDNDNRIGGAALGAAGGAIGQGVGELASIPIGALARTRLVQAVGRMFGRGLDAAPKPSAAQSTLLSTINGAGPDAIKTTLADAQRLGVPMSLADTTPSLGELAGAAVRRSPNAANAAEAALLPRGRGQYDRLGSAVTRDLGPIANIPQTSEDLMRQARTRAAPLYEAAYAQPAVGSPELDSLLQTPAGKSALSRAHTIAANERRDPRALGFALDANGTVTLNPVRGDLYGAHAQAQDAFTQAQEAHRIALRTPGMDSDTTRDALISARSGLKDATDALAAAPSDGTAATSRQYTPQTLDYVKRGIDDVIDGLPKGMNGRPIMDEHYRAVDGVRRQLLGELDTLNPTYGAARRAYAGPASAREALNLGTDAVTMHPDELSILAGAQSPERLAQMQTGFRGELMNRAGALRDSTNPWEAALGTPNARARVNALYPDNPGSADLFRQRDLEGQMAATKNTVIGNSKTAGRTIADKAFMVAAPATMAVDAASMLHGGVPYATAAAYGLRHAANSAAASAIKDRLPAGAVAKADELLPMLLNTDPGASAASIDDLVKQQLAYRAYVQASRPRRMFGAGFGSAGIAAGSNF